MKKIITILFIVNAVVIGTVVLLTQNQTRETELDLLKLEYSEKHVSSVDHTKFDVLKKPFSSPEEVTEACLSCHTERGKEVLNSSHFQWSREEYIKGRGVVKAGKKNLINNFCIGILAGNEALCNKCHAGYGWADTTFDFTSEHSIDCMICHDNSGRYEKKNKGAGYPLNKTDFNYVSQHVGLPKKENCGACHFLGGGGNNVKHGDLEVALYSSDADVDVHIGYDGGSMECIACHTAERHQMKGQMYTVSSMNKDRAHCTDCHSPNLHEDEIINEHSVKVSCQACHIPTYAKVNATKTHWDWSTAGKLKDGQPYTVDDEDGNHVYFSNKGSFKWGKNLEPDYVWFNGTADHYFLGEEIDTSKISPEDSCKVTELNTLHGAYNDPDSKIIPVKIQCSKQLYDTKTNLLIAPKLHGPKGSGAFWSDYDFDMSAQKGMEMVGLEYSGHYDFVKTKMYWPVNHMVSKADKALACTECHSKESRLSGLDDFYMPGRDQNEVIDTAGIGLILLTLFGVIGHGLLRIFHGALRKKQIKEKE